MQVKKIPGWIVDFFFQKQKLLKTQSKKHEIVANYNKNTEETTYINQLNIFST